MEKQRDSLRTERAVEAPHTISPIETVRREIVWSSPWYQIRQDQIILPDGSPGVFNVIMHPGAAFIIPVTDKGQIVLLRHYRYTVEDWCWEIPAGGLNEDTTPVETAAAELREEIGGTARTLEYLGQFYTANGICDEIAHVFLASGVQLAEPNHEPLEVMEIHPMPAEEVFKMAHSNKISDGPSALALLLFEEKIRIYLDNS